jgi:hypothetical protein
MSKCRKKRAAKKKKNLLKNNVKNVQNKMQKR